MAEKECNIIAELLDFAKANKVVVVDFYAT